MVEGLNGAPEESMVVDRPISYTTDKKRLQSVIATAAHLGYSTVAINYVVDLQQKKQGIGKPKCVSELFDTFPKVQERPTAEYKAYDLVAVYPKTEKLFHAIERGVFFEISYTPAIRDSTMRRYTIANSISLMETCKGKNAIVTSGAEKPLELRGPYDIGNFPEAYFLACRKETAKLRSPPTVELSAYIEKQERLPWVLYTLGRKTSR